MRRFHICKFTLLTSRFVKKKGKGNNILTLTEERLSRVGFMTFPNHLMAEPVTELMSLG
jgi:hypothetical protein